MGRVAPEQHFAANAMKLRFECATARTIHSLKRFVDSRNCALDIAGARFGLGERNSYEPVKEQNLLFAQKFDAATHAVEPIESA